MTNTQLLLFKPEDGVPLSETDKYQLAMQRLIDNRWAVSEIIRLGKILANPRKWSPNIQATVREDAQ